MDLTKRETFEEDYSGAEAELCIKGKKEERKREGGVERGWEGEEEEREQESAHLTVR